MVDAECDIDGAPLQQLGCRRWLVNAGDVQRQLAEPVAGPGRHAREERRAGGGQPQRPGAVGLPHLTGCGVSADGAGAGHHIASLRHDGGAVAGRLDAVGGAFEQGWPK
ncbi:hypothetical protein [Kitasatospora acidiphila]|uniref:hypothetical protein n=1 Tax=Kitasatospora acidiphila TaxID=2567942 RepID=UPI002B4001B9|nr:hypothetical protein [Kitasatospora acidiphila]